MPYALVREISPTFPRALCARPPVPPIDVARAREQHAAYLDGLRWLGYQVLVLGADDLLADSCFVEDAAVVAGGLALATRPGAPSRRGEVEAVARALGAHLPVVRMAEPATLDGGDVLGLGRRIFVGLSSRTNEAGLAQLAAAFAPRGFEILALPVGEALHLKCACSPLGDHRVLVAEGALPQATFAPAAAVTVPAEEAYAANCVARGRRVLAAAGHPRTRERLEAAGFEVREVAGSEFRKADGALTCLSLRWE